MQKNIIINYILRNYSGPFIQVEAATDLYNYQHRHNLRDIYKTQESNIKKEENQPQQK